MTRKHLHTFNVCSLCLDDSTLLLSADNYVESVSIFMNKGTWVLANKPSKILAVVERILEICFAFYLLSFWKSKGLLNGFELSNNFTNSYKIGQQELFKWPGFFYSMTDLRDSSSSQRNLPPRTFESIERNSDVQIPLLLRSNIADKNKPQAWKYYAKYFPSFVFFYWCEITYLKSNIFFHLAF